MGSLSGQMAGRKGRRRQHHSLQPARSSWAQAPPLHTPVRRKPRTTLHGSGLEAFGTLIVDTQATGWRQEEDKEMQKYVDNQGTNGLTLNTKRQEKHYRLVKMLP